MCALDKDELQRKSKLRTVISKKALSRSRRLIDGSIARIERAAKQKLLQTQKKKSTKRKAA